MNVKKLRENTLRMVLCEKRQRLILCMVGNRIGVWNINDATLEHCFEQDDMHMFCPAMSLHPSEPLVAVTCLHGNRWFVFDFERGHTQDVFLEQSHIELLEFSRQGDVVHNVSKTLLFRPAEDLSQMQIVGEHVGVEIAAFDNTGTVIASGGWDKHIMVWLRFDIGWACFRRINTRKTVYTCAFDSQNRLLTQSYCQTPRIWCEHFAEYTTLGNTEDIKDIIINHDFRGVSVFSFKGLPLYSNDTDSWIMSMCMSKSGPIFVLDNYHNLFMLERLVSKDVIVAANLALFKKGLHRDVRDAIFRSLCVLDKKFNLRPVYK